MIASLAVTSALFAFAVGSAAGTMLGATAPIAGANFGFKPKPKRIASASAFALPSTKKCVSDRKLTIVVHKLPHVRWLALTIKVDGRRFETVKRAQIIGSTQLKRLPAGSFALSIAAKANDRRKVSVERDYHACAPAGNPTKPTHPVKPPATPEQPVTKQTPPTEQPATTPEQPVTKQTPPTEQPATSKSPIEGSYTGSDPQELAGGEVKFFVSPSGNLQDVTIETTRMTCAPSKVIDDHFEMLEVPVAANGSFSLETEQSGILETGYTEYARAHFSYSLSGELQEGHATGVFREEVTYDNGTSYVCSTSDQSWTASRDEQQGAATFPAAEGSYTGSDPQELAGGEVKFFVSPSGNLQDVTVETTRLGCNPNKSVDDHFEMLEVPVAANGSFSQEATENRSIETAYKEFNEAHITYTLSGHVHGANASGEQQVAGVFREDLSYDNGTSYSCSTSSQSWLAAHD